MKKLFLVLAGGFVFTTPAMAHDKHFFHEHVVEYHQYYHGHTRFDLPTHNHCHRHKKLGYSHCHRHVHGGPGMKGHHGRKRMHDAFNRTHIDFHFYTH